VNFSLFLKTDSKPFNGRYYCQHCKGLVSKSTFYEHRALYGNSSRDERDNTISVDAAINDNPHETESDSEDPCNAECLEDEIENFSQYESSIESDMDECSSEDNTSSELDGSSSNSDVNSEDNCVELDKVQCK